MRRGGERRHVGVHLDGLAALELDALREVWDPRMRSITPPHVTVVYREETVDEDRLVESLRAAAVRSDPVAPSTPATTPIDSATG